MKLSLILITLLLVSCSKLKQINVEGMKQERSAFNRSWMKDMDPTYDTGNLPIGVQSPLIYEGLLFVGQNTGIMGAYVLKNGQKVWEAKDNSEYSTRPVANGDYIYYGTKQGRVISRNYLTGEIQYEVDLGASVETEITIHRGRLFVQLRNHKLISLDAATGKTLWAYKRNVPYLTTIQRASTPIIHNNRVIVGFADGTVASFNIEDGLMIWDRKLSSGSKFVDVDASPVIFNNELVVGSLNGPLTFMEPKSGKILRRLDYSISRSPVVQKNGLILGTIDGEVIFLSSRLTILNKVKVTNSVITSFVPWKDGVVVSTSKRHLYYLDRDLEVKEKLDLGHSSSAVFGIIEAKEDHMALVSSRNRLYVFR